LNPAFFTTSRANLRMLISSVPPTLKISPRAFAVLSPDIVASCEDFSGAWNLFRFPGRRCFKVGLRALAQSGINFALLWLRPRRAASLR
jgi:hypothetical protein